MDWPPGMANPAEAVINPVTRRVDEAKRVVADRPADAVIRPEAAMVVLVNPPLAEMRPLAVMVVATIPPAAVNRLPAPMFTGPLTVVVPVKVRPLRVVMPVMAASVKSMDAPAEKSNSPAKCTAPTPVRVIDWPLGILNPADAVITPLAVIVDDALTVVVARPADAVTRPDALMVVALNPPFADIRPAAVIVVEALRLVVLTPPAVTASVLLMVVAPATFNGPLTAVVPVNVALLNIDAGRVITALLKSMVAPAVKSKAPAKWTAPGPVCVMLCPPGMFIPAEAMMVLDAVNVVVLTPADAVTKPEALMVVELKPPFAEIRPAAMMVVEALKLVVEMPADAVSSPFASSVLAMAVAPVMFKEPLTFVVPVRVTLLNVSDSPVTVAPLKSTLVPAGNTNEPLKTTSPRPVCVMS